jgi:hypothetical protein
MLARRIHGRKRGAVCERGEQHDDAAPFLEPEFAFVRA